MRCASRAARQPSCASLNAACTRSGSAALAIPAHHRTPACHNTDTSVAKPCRFCKLGANPPLGAGTSPWSRRLCATTLSYYYPFC